MPDHLAVDPRGRPGGQRQAFEGVAVQVGEEGEACAAAAAEAITASRSRRFIPSAHWVRAATR